MRFRHTLLATSLLALPVAAKAQAVNGPYFSLGAGVNLMQNENMSLNFPGHGASANAKTQVGPAVVGSAGYGLGNGLRIELEGDYLYNALSGTASGSTIAFGGHEQKYGAMVNVLYDFVGIVPMVQPYVGVGGGYQWQNFQNFHAAGPGFTVAAANQTKGSAAYQAILGLAMPIAAAPGMAVDIEYRFMGLMSNRTYTAIADVPAPVAGSVRSNHDYNNMFLVGFRYNFGQTPPPAPVAAPAPAPAPAVQPARSYLVFFDWDKATLTDRARAIIKEAADNSTHVQYTRIEVNGYTDTSGTPQYNQGLSVRRAQAVAAELVHDGVPQNAITAQGFGETHLLVPTGPGVREPQNRRVEIIIR